MKLWIIYSKVVLNPNKNNAISWMLDEAKACDFDAEVLFAEDLLIDSTHKLYNNGQEKKLPDVVLTRCYDIHLLKHFELAGIPVFNSSSSMNNCLNKWTTHQLLSTHHIPTPHTIYGEHETDFDTIANILECPFIVKDIYGARGEQVFLIHDKETFEKALKQCKKPLFQAYISSSYGRDIRVHVIGGRVVTSVLRTSSTNFKSNFSQGGQATAYTPDETVKMLAINSTKILGLDFSGVDILFTPTGYTVCEVNGVPGFRTIGLTSKFNIPQAMMKHIRSSI